MRDATAEAFLSTPLPRPSPPHPPRRLAYYGAACASLKLVGERIRDFGLPPEHAPLFKIDALPSEVESACTCHYGDTTDSA